MVIWTFTLVLDLLFRVVYVVVTLAVSHLPTNISFYALSYTDRQVLLYVLLC